MKDMQEKLRAAVKTLLDKHEVAFVIGYQRGSVRGRSKPCFVRTPEQADQLIWDQTCSNNLTVYLPPLFRRPRLRPGQEPPPLPRVGIVVKGCDALSVAGLVREKQVPRANIVAIGMPCQGILDPDSKQVLPSCLDCQHPVPEQADIKIDGPAREPAKDPLARAREFEAKPIEERWRYFAEQIKKCIRCYACREACPNCYCKSCFADSTNPRWIGLSSEQSDTMLYQLGRLFHQAGRCVGCNACVRACPMGVDLHTFTTKLLKDAKELFDDTPGEDTESVPLLSTFDPHDSDAFITDPDKQD